LRVFHCFSGRGFWLRCFAAFFVLVWHKVLFCFIDITQDLPPQQKPNPARRIQSARDNSRNVVSPLPGMGAGGSSNLTFAPGVRVTFRAFRPVNMRLCLPVSQRRRNYGAKGAESGDQFDGFIFHSANNALSTPPKLTASEIAKFARSTVLRECCRP
jgi:hypothetical protein